MTQIESDPVEIDRTPAELTGFLINMEHIGTLMPEQVENWEVDGDACRFRIKGMADIGMKIAEHVPGERVTLESWGKVPFPFTLSCLVSPTGDEASKLTLRMDAELNPMLKALATTPLRNFLNLLADKCQKVA